MSQATVITSFLFFLVQMKSTQLCSPYMCFNWKVSNKNLTLICKVSNLRYRVSFVDPHDQTKADCVPFPALICDVYNSNGVITLNVQTNETVFIIKGNIDNHYNGIWTCQHGYKSEVARIEVTVFKKGTETNNITNQSVPLLPEKTGNTKLQCVKDVLVYSMTSLIMSIVSTLMVSAWNSKCPENMNDKLWEKCTEKDRKGTTKKMQIGFAILTVSFFLFNSLIGYFDDGSCQYIKWILTAAAFIIGILGSCFCLYRYAQNESEVHEDISEPLRANQEDQTNV